MQEDSANEALHAGLAVVIGPDNNWNWLLPECYDHVPAWRGTMTLDEEFADRQCAEHNAEEH